MAARPRFVVILPITHTPPLAGVVAIAIPPRVAQAIGLDDAPSWIIASEHNVDEWPNPGISPIPGRPRVFSYGFIPPRLFAAVKTAFLELGRTGGGFGVRR